MSSTNRGYNRHKSDYYVTPKNDVIMFLNHFTKVNDISNDLIQDFKFLDPCCGGDELNEPTYLNIIKELYNPKKIVGIDIREDSKADIKTDFITHYQPNEKFDIIISNPPFYLAEEFIKKSLELTEFGGYVIMLLRLNFFGSKKRKPIFEKTMPHSCYVHHKRISFMNGATDSIEYAHFVWQKGVNNDFCKTYVI
jgi:hypothetical protein